MQVAAVDLRKIVLFPLESSQISHAHVRSILWSGDLQPSFHMCPEHTKPLIDLFKDNKFYVLVLKVPYGFVQDSIILNDGSQPELGSVLL